MDNLTPAQRSATMARVRSRDTGPEVLVRRLAHSAGYRYRLYRAELPGKPDLVFSGLKKAIFVHGCFWHGHSCPAGAKRPKTNRLYWSRKIERNRRRDARVRSKLRRIGWKTMTIWGCQLENASRLRSRIERFLEA